MMALFYNSLFFCQCCIEKYLFTLNVTIESQCRIVDLYFRIKVDDSRSHSLPVFVWSHVVIAGSVNSPSFLAKLVEAGFLNDCTS